MQKCARIFLCAISITLLAGCGKQPTLEDKLAAAATPAEREQTAYYECIHTVHYPIPGGHSDKYFGHEQRQWVICDRMHDLNKAEK